MIVKQNHSPLTTPRKPDAEAAATWTTVPVPTTVRATPVMAHATESPPPAPHTTPQQKDLAYLAEREKASHKDVWIKALVVVVCFRLAWITWLLLR